MWRSTAIPSPQNLQHALVSVSELQALFNPALKKKGEQSPMPQLNQAWTLWSDQSPNESRLNARDNLILAALSTAELAALAPHLELVTLGSGQVIGQPGQVMEHVYFPLGCSVSWVSHTADGESAELVLVGCDGLIGVPLVLGGLTMQHAVQVQFGGQALRMGADVFLRILGTQLRLHKLALLYVQWQMAQMTQSIVCSRHHAVSERLSHWLLSNAQAAKRLELHVTHETISHMLGVRRESVTQAAGRFQAAGWIDNSRGKITLKDTDSLARIACECHVRSRAESQRYVQQLARLALTPNGHDHPGAMSMSGYGAATPMLTTDVRPPLPTELSPYGLSHAEAAESEPVGNLQKYVDAYDFAPVGFVTLDAQGKILQTNLAGAILLDIQRSQCQHQLFSDFLDGESQAPFARFHHEVLGGQCRRHCVVQLTAAAHRSALRVRIDATADEWGVENRMVLIDLSEEATNAGSQVKHWPFQSADAGAAPGAWSS
jgi:CRP-like cAMP-binding protein